MQSWGLGQIYLGTQHLHTKVSPAEADGDASKQVVSHWGGAGSRCSPIHSLLVFIESLSYRPDLSLGPRKAEGRGLANRKLAKLNFVYS